MGSARAVIDPLYKPKRPKVFNRGGSVTQTEKALVHQFVADQPSAIRPSQVTALAKVLRRSRDAVKSMIEEAREDLASGIGDYVRAHKEAMTMALANGDAKSLEVAARAAQWGLENISIEGVRVVDKAKGEDNGVRVFIGVKVGGMKALDQEAKVDEISGGREGSKNQPDQEGHSSLLGGGIYYPDLGGCAPSGQDEKYKVKTGEIIGGESGYYNLHQNLVRCFNYFIAYEISIVGSACRNMDTAHDIDILFDKKEDFPKICRTLGIKYSGWDTPTHHVRKASFRIPGVDKPIHLLSWGGYDDGSCQIKRDGIRIHDNQWFDKESGQIVRGLSGDE